LYGLSDAAEDGDAAVVVGVELSFVVATEFDIGGLGMA